MKKILLITLATLVLMLTFPLPVLAIDDPDSPPAINAVYLYENALEDGDLGVLIDYFLDYAVLPAETATEAYIASFVDTDGATQLATVAPYTFQSSGYGRGLIWIYFTPAEVTANGIDSANVVLHEVWLMGNPTVASGWTGDPPKTIAGIDQWSTVADPSTLIALRVLFYADLLELAWSLDLIEETAIGNRLTTLGADYFINVIPDLRTIAPAAFSSGETSPAYTPISYDTSFGATATSGTATVIGSPQTLVSGNNTVDTGATTGTIVIDLAQWTFGTITDGTGTIAGTPFALNPGANTLTVTGAGNFTVEVAVVDTVTVLEATAIGTGLDLTDIGTAFGMSRWFMSGLVWMLTTVIICAAVYRTEKSDAGVGVDLGGSRVIVLVFTVCIIGGTLLGLLHPMVAALLFIGSGALIGYVFFFRSETLQKGFMFMIWMFVIVSVAGNVLAGSTSLVATRLTADLLSNETSTISVASTEGFGESGILVIGDERVGYPSKTATTFDRTAVLGATTNPILRGIQDTDADAHATGDTVRTLEAGLLNSSIDYKIVRIADSAGVAGMIALPIRLLDLVLTFFVLPLDFLGTDLVILAYIWGIVAIGMVFGVGMALVGARRV
tara:strand:+ start:3434 stop:5275 length:1842 start_codon:yes stop_codon:yes gene_type:complete